MPAKYIEAGKIVGTHGVRGEMRVDPWCDSAGFLCRFKKLYLDASGTQVIAVTSARPHGNICLIKADGVDIIEQAEALRGRSLYIDRSDCRLEKGRYFISDIIGCEVVSASGGETLGTVCDVSNTGANDIWHIKRDGKVFLVPNNPEFVKSVDIENKKIVYSPIKGMFDDED